MNATDPIDAHRSLQKAARELAHNVTHGSEAQYLNAIDNLEEKLQDVRRLSDHTDQIYLPNDGELMAARGAIISYIDSIKNGNLEPTSEVLDTIIKAVVVSLRWSPQQ